MEYLKEILFIDIETVPTQPEYHLLPHDIQYEWIRKTKNMKGLNEATTDAAQLFSERAGIFSEFAKVICIGFGSLTNADGKWNMRLKALTNDNEKILLQDFCSMVQKFTRHYKEIRFCGHNIKEFDIPFLCRRMIVNNRSACSLPVKNLGRGPIWTPWICGGSAIIKILRPFRYWQRCSVFPPLKLILMGAW